LGVIAGSAALIAMVILFLSRGYPAPGDISSALSRNPKAYKLSLGHMEDLTLASFAYLRLPLAMAALALALGCVGTFKANTRRAALAAALMMALFFHAARVAMVAFDPYLSSRPLAEALLKSPDGTLIVDHHYYTFSSVFFYTNRSALLLNGRRINLEYGSYAPGAPDVFIDDAQFHALWLKPERCYIVADASAMPRLESLVGHEELTLVAESGGKVLLTNHPPASKAQRTDLDAPSLALAGLSSGHPNQSRTALGWDKIMFSAKWGVARIFAVAYGSVPNRDRIYGTTVPGDTQRLNTKEGK